MVTETSLFHQHKRQLYTWISAGCQYLNQIDYVLCSWRWRRYIKSAKTRPGADCGSGHELLIDKIRFKWKKVGKTISPLGNGLNHIAYDHTVQFSCSVVSDSLRPHGLKHAWPPYPSPTPGAYSNSFPLSRWCNPTILSSVIPFSSCLHPFQ